MNITDKGKPLLPGNQEKSFIGGVKVKIKNFEFFLKEKIRESVIVVKKKFFSPGGVKSTTANLLIATLGPGMLALPTAFRSSGVVWSFVEFLLAAIVSWLSMYCLVNLNLNFFFSSNPLIAQKNILMGN